MSAASPGAGHCAVTRSAPSPDEPASSSATSQHPAVQRVGDGLRSCLPQSLAFFPVSDCASCRGQFDTDLAGSGGRRRQVGGGRRHRQRHEVLHGQQLVLALGLADPGLDEVGVESVLQRNLGNRGITLQAGCDDLRLE